MTTSPADLAWASRWKAVRPNAVYNAGYGLEGAWRGAADEWGWPLEDFEQDVDVNGQTMKARTFSKIGLVAWNPSTGATILGWP